MKSNQKRSFVRKEFLTQLQNEAQLQASLSQDYLLPRSLSQVSSLVFDHSLFFIAASSLMLAIISLIII